MTSSSLKSTSQEPTLTSILQTPEAFALESVLTQNPSYMIKLIDYISVVPDPMFQNERECYFYPLKAGEILNSVGVYKLLIKKEVDTMNIDATDSETHEETKYFYPFLDRLFKNLKGLSKAASGSSVGDCQGEEELLLGYIDRLLYGVTKKTPEIYEFIKDNEDCLMLILKTDNILLAFKEFLVLFLTESTMQLYVFIKNLILRTLMFRIVEEEETGPVAYEMLYEFYTELLKSCSGELPEDDLEELTEVLKNIEEENFIALLALKVDPQNPRITYSISKLLNSIVSSPNSCIGLVIPYIDTFTEYLEDYEQSEQFTVQGVKTDQLMMLKLTIRIINAVQKEQLIDVKQELLKRLLVYCHIYTSHSILHNMLYSLLGVLSSQGLSKLIVGSKMIELFKNDMQAEEAPSFNFRGLVRRVCRFLTQNQMTELLEEEEKTFVSDQLNPREKLLSKAKYFKKKQSPEPTKEITEKIIAQMSSKTIEDQTEVKEFQIGENQQEGKDSPQKTADGNQS